MPNWLKDILKEIPQKLIVEILIGLGIVSLIVGFLKSFGIRIYDLMNMQTTIGALLILCALFYFLGRQNIKSKLKPKKVINEITTIQHELIQFGRLKWDVTVYSDGHFEISDIPFCAYHDLRLVENGPLYFCPRFDECHVNISNRDIPFTIGNIESHIEKQLREKRTQSGSRG